MAFSETQLFSVVEELTQHAVHGLVVTTHRYTLAHLSEASVVV